MAASELGEHKVSIDFSLAPTYTTGMFSRVYSCAVIGLDGVVVEVEVEID